MTARAAALLAITAVVACAMRASAVPHGGPAPVVVAPSTSRAATVLADVVATLEARNRGLGGRAALPPDGGMLFVYDFDTPAPRTYWMKDCLIALDIAFIGPDRRILNVATLPAGAGLPEPQIARADSRGPASWVLETGAGWFARHGLGAGDEVDLSAALPGVVPR